jgi:hypothetical protein
VSVRRDPLVPLRRRAPRAALAPAWRRWLLADLARGVEPAALAAVLRAHGVPGDEARRRLREAGEAAALVRHEAAWARRLELVLRLRRALRSPTVERRAAPTTGEFFARYWETGTPAVFTDLVPRWPGFGRWGAEDLRARFGEVEVEVETGRAGDPECDIRFREHRATMTLAAYVERVLAGGPDNDVYMIANNRNLARPGLRPLLDELWFPPGWVEPARLPGGSALWLGPAGTVTALHHDTSNILFCQVVGRKRFRLAAPAEPTLLRRARGVYSRVDPERGDEWAAVAHYDLTLGPGDALFIPAGWWHHVRALDLSVSVAVNAFTRPNAYDWYKPGAEEQ